MNMLRPFHILLVPLLVAVSLVAAADDVPMDPFEAIAREKNAETLSVKPNPIPRLPDTELPWDAALEPAFKPSEKISTQAELDAELQRMRAKYAPFMADLAPALSSPRQQLELKNFSWRYETPEDIADPERVHKGQGEWKQITIPHYWGPTNDATSYYRAELMLDERMLGPDSLVIHFNGSDYSTDVYLNGQHIGSHTGLFDPFEFNIKPVARPGKNILVVKARNDAVQMGDNHNTGPGRKYGRKIAGASSMGWDEPFKGWVNNPVGFGLWQRAWLEARAGTYINDMFVRPLPQDGKAELWLEVVQKGETAPSVSYSVYGQNFQATLAENKVDPGQFHPQSNGTYLYKTTIPFPDNELRRWSPEEPWLYQIQVKLSQDGKVVDAIKKQFGMRSFVQSETSEPKGRFYLNGKEVRLRGANMGGNLMQCVYRGDFDQLRDDILIAKIANMNFWRMTQQPCQPEVYDYFDRLGMMAQTDLPLFVGLRRDTADIALEQVKGMERLIRNHPSNIVISYINEPIFEFYDGRVGMMPRNELVPTFRVFDEAVWKLNPDQVIKWVDGDYADISTKYSDHHCYSLWYKGHGLGFRQQYFGAWMATPPGWMYGCGEFGSEGLDSPELMKKYYPKEWIEEKPDGSWSPYQVPRAQSGKMGPAWYGYTPKTMKEWVDVSHNHQYWATRLMTEALRRDPKMNSYAVHLLIDAWPAGALKTIMDCDRQAKPAYFAFRDASVPLMVSLRPDRFYSFSGERVKIAAWVANDTNLIPDGAKLRYQVKLGEEVIRTGSAPAKVASCGPEFEGWLAFDSPKVDKRQPMTVQLGLFDGKGQLFADTTQIIDLFPSADKPSASTAGGPPDAGGYPQRLIENDYNTRAPYQP